MNSKVCLMKLTEKCLTSQCCCFLRQISFGCKIDSRLGHNYFINFKAQIMLLKDILFNYKITYTLLSTFHMVQVMTQNLFDETL